MIVQWLWLIVLFAGCLIAMFSPIAGLINLFSFYYRRLISEGKKARFERWRFRRARQVTIAAFIVFVMVFGTKYKLFSEGPGGQAMTLLGLFIILSAICLIQWVIALGYKHICKSIRNISDEKLLQHYYQSAFSHSLLIAVPLAPFVLNLLLEQVG